MVNCAPSKISLPSATPMYCGSPRIRITSPSLIRRVKALRTNWRNSSRENSGCESNGLGERNAAGFFRETLKNDTADLILGAPTGYERALTTAPYYRSSYVFVYRKDRALDLRSLDDPRLRELKVGVQIVGDDGANTPPAHALASRGIIHNLVGFTLYGDYSEPNPPARIIDAVNRGDIDVAIAWGPLAGYFAKQSSVPLEVVPVTPQVEPSGLRFAFSVSMGVRKKDSELQKRVDEVLQRNRAEIERLLDEYGVPRVEGGNRTTQLGG